MARRKLTPVKFAELFFNWKAFDYQKKPLNDMSKRVVLACGRQIGKTEMAALRALYEAVVNPGTTNLILAPVQRQARILFRRLKYFINVNSQLPEGEKLDLSSMIDRETQTEIELNNNSMLYCLPISEDGSNIRGFTANWIGIDEAEHVKDEAWAAINPMLATTHGTLWLTGTFYGTNNMFYKWFKQGERYKELKIWKDGEHFSPYKFPSSVSPLITKEFLKQEESRLPYMEYQQEYEARPLETVGTVWTEKLLDDVMRESCPLRSGPIQGHRYYLGYDVARFGDDEAVGIIIERRTERSGDEEFYMVNSFEMKGQSLDYQVKYLESLHRIWNFEKIIVDSTGVGSGVSDPLRGRALPVLDFNFTIKSKQDSYFHATRMLETGKVTLQKHPKLRKQMLEMKREDRSDGFTKIYHPAKTGGDDWPTALVLALWGVKSKNLDIHVARSSKSFF